MNGSQGIGFAHALSEISQALGDSSVHSESNDDGDDDKESDDNNEDPSGEKTIGWEKTGLTNDKTKLFGLL